MRVDTSSVAGELVFHVFGAIAHFERDLIRERTMAGDAGRFRSCAGACSRLDFTSEGTYPGAQRLMEHRHDTGETMRRIMFLTLAACAAAGIGIALARAEPGPIGQWLMDEPVSLWDWGMRNTREAVDEAAGSVVTEGVPEVSHQNSFAHYDWDNNEIVIRLWAAFPTGSPITHEVCNHVRETFLLALAPPFPDGPNDLAARAGRALDRWFSHDGFIRTNRDPELGNKLARIVWVEVAVYDGFWPKMPAGSNTVICKARITEEEALSRSWP